METGKKPVKPVFDMTIEELEAHLKPVTEKVIQDTFNKDLPISYRDERCPTAAHYVHEYRDGRVQLVVFDTETRETTVVKNLPNA